jgi:hypothetical protein
MTNVVSINMPTLNEHAAEIRRLGKQIIEDVIEIGRRLSECRAILKQNGKWRAWLKTEFGWSRQSAERFIQLFEMSGSWPKLGHSNLPISALYLLANPSTPEKVRKEFLTGSIDKKITHKDIAARLKHSKGGDNAKLTDQRRAEIAKAIIGGMSQKDVIEKFACGKDTFTKLRKQLIAEGKLMPKDKTPPPADAPARPTKDSQFYDVSDQEIDDVIKLLEERFGDLRHMHKCDVMVKVCHRFNISATQLPERHEMWARQRGLVTDVPLFIPGKPKRK